MSAVLSAHRNRPTSRRMCARRLSFFFFFNLNIARDGGEFVYGRLDCVRFRVDGSLALCVPHRLSWFPRVLTDEYVFYANSPLTAGRISMHARVNAGRTVACKRLGLSSPSHRPSGEIVYSTAQMLDDFDTRIRFSYFVVRKNGGIRRL